MSTTIMGGRPLTAQKTDRPTFDAHTGDLSQLRTLGAAKLAQEREANARGREALAREERDSVQTMLASVLRQKLGIVNATLDATADVNAPTCTIDGIKFYVNRHDHCLQIVRPCPGCEQNRYSSAIDGPATFAAILEDFDANCHYHMHSWSEDSTDPRAPHNQPKPEPALVPDPIPLSHEEAVLDALTRIADALEQMNDYREFGAR